MARHFTCEGTIADLSGLDPDLFTDGDTASAPGQGEPERKRSLWRCEIEMSDTRTTIGWARVGPWSDEVMRAALERCDEVMVVKRRSASGHVACETASK